MIIALWYFGTVGGSTRAMTPTFRPSTVHVSCALVLCGALLGTACDSDPGDGDGDGSACADETSLSYATSVKPIIDETCVEGCHEPGGIWILMDLSGDSYSTIVGKPSGQNLDMDFVAPCDAQASYLFHKVAGSHEANGGADTKRMPLDPDTCTEDNYLTEDCTESPLSADDVATIETWINGGAQP